MNEDHLNIDDRMQVELHNGWGEWTQVDLDGDHRIKDPFFQLFPDSFFINFHADGDLIH
jgi:hypothetical protein